MMACEICKKQYAPSSQADGKPHVCFTCGKSFSLKIQLKRHMETHESGKSYICDACEKEDKQSYNLRLSKKTSFVCEQCKKQFITERMLLQHVSEHNLVNCDECSESFKNVTDLKKHSTIHKSKRRSSKKQKVDSDERYQCDDCDRSFTQSHKLEKHRLSHKSFQCDVCEANFSFKKGLVEHCLTGCKTKKTSDDAMAKKHVCSLCNQTFARKSALEGHILSHLTEKGESAPEDDSDNDADFLINYQGGKSSNHQVKEMCLPKLKIRRSFPCDVCEKICASQKILEKHMLSHKKFNQESIIEEKKIYTCRVCDETFLAKGDYKKHKQTHNSKSLDVSDTSTKLIKTYMCKICCQVFMKKKHLKKHFKTHSSNLDAPETNSVNLNESRRKRQKRIKDLACSICGKLFAGEICLRKHELKHKCNDNKVRKVRTPQSLICPFCKEDFTGRKFVFMRHKLSHTPEICGICDERFVDRAALREHLKTHIGTEEARKFLECSQRAQNVKSNLQNTEGKVEYIYLVLR